MWNILREDYNEYRPGDVRELKIKTP